jgi:hypothetical protein
MVGLLGLEVNAEKTDCLLREQNAEETECMFICGRQNHNKLSACSYVAGGITTN